MATFLRFLIGLLAFVYVQAAVVGSIVLLFRHAIPVLPELTIALLLLGMTPAIAGGVTSYTTWLMPESRRRLRRVVVALVVTMAVSTALLIVTAFFGVPWWFVGTALFAAFVLTPASLVLGRAARRRDRLDPAGDEWMDSTRLELRRGGRRGAIGFAIGLAVGVLALALVWALGRPRASESGQDLALVLGVAFLGAAIGMAVTTLSVSRLLREVTGAEYDVRRRIARVVIRGKSEPLNATEQRSAARYARVVGPLLVVQTAQSLSLIAGIALLNGHVLAEPHPDGLAWTGLAFIVLAAVLVMMAIPQTIIRVRRARAYAEEHAALA